MVSLAEILKRVDPEAITEAMFEHEEIQAPRTIEEIQSAEQEFFDKVWYDRHQMLAHRVASGQTKLVADATASGYNPAEIQERVWKGAWQAAWRVEARYGPENLGPWTDFEWGMLNGKLSALRWVLGDEWDFLDT